MHIFIELKRWMTSTPPAISVDLTPYDRVRAIEGLKRLAEHDFGDCYAKHGQPREAASPAIDRFFEQLGPDDADALVSIPRGEDAHGDFYLTFRTTTKETQERQSRLLDEILSQQKIEDDVIRHFSKLR